MSKRVLIQKKGFILNNAPSQNGIGRYIPQLQRLTLKFCKESPSSLGIRNFIESDFVGFAEKNPHVALYLKPRRRRSPVLVAEYLNGERHWQNLRYFTPEEVAAWLDIYNSHSGKEYQYQEKWSYSNYASIQGLWHPFVHKDPSLALATFPNEDSAQPPHLKPSVSSKLIQLYEEQKGVSSVS
ncbi:large ribosomal subunit protein mL43 [Lepeophtheirus salmonis]|uniref:Large ribosomal subunit protein mL43 n=1 Tax=Lepeophtheirus salmonis TaxID=72036 RepID=C1BUT4_LEPSM|nr:39S ribosomal protein L43, mitochondrial-like [Lepeophtheirus salmonis]ACO12787.1 39S ribosomal protein L43, mitochondrial precursor [Lepeophtheirus salmonis]